MIKRKTIFMGLIILFLTVMVVFFNPSNSFCNDAKKDYIYLSDVSYDSSKSFAAGGHIIRLDKNEADDLIKLYIEKKERLFFKGICAWATSEIVYDLREYDYDYFTSYIGVDVREQNDYFNTGVVFKVYVSDDGTNWGNPIYTSKTLKGWDNAEFININIKNVKYLKLVADDNSNNWWANWYDEAVYANAKLIKEGYVEDNTNVDFIKTVEEYDAIIKNAYETNQDMANYELTLLQRDLVKNVGYDMLQEFVKYSDENREAILWLMNDVKNLKMYIVGGRPNGSYIESLRVLSQLYSAYKEDLTNDLYLKMVISLSLSHSKTVRFWINDKFVKADGTVVYNTDPNSPNISNAVRRYKILKEQYLAGKLNNRIFEQLEVEEMRYIMSSDIPDGEIKWLRDYTELKNNTNPYGYLRYTTTVNYWNPQYYSAENKAKWNAKYGFDEYEIGYTAHYPRLWIIFEQGGVCWQISNTGQNIQTAYGIPSTTVGQPGHVAYLIYSLNNNGDGIWSIWNDVGGWTKTNAAGYANHTSYYKIRWMNEWGSGSYASPYMGSYILLAQAAINDFENYEKSEEILLLANTYSNDKAKLEEIYRKALQVQNINFDAWYGLVNLYVNDSTKTENDLFELAEEIASSLKYYPLPMYDLFRMIFNKINSTEFDVKLTLLQTRTLTEASRATDTESIQANVVKIMANYLLGIVNNEIATFSFDGENAKVLSLASRYEATQVTWDYSLDGGNNWKQITEHSVKLTETEIDSITAENDIKVHIVGTDYSKNNIYTIDIKKGTTSSGLYANDLENRVIGVDQRYEWKLNDTDNWTSYASGAPDLTGNKSVMIREIATGLFLASDPTTYNFTEDNQPDTRKYIPISHLSVYEVSSEETSKGTYGANAIDGNINTIWHSAYNGSDSQRFITIELDEVVYLSALEYVPRQSGNNGRSKSGELLVSIDGEKWTKVATFSNWANNGSTKVINLENSVEAKYVKFITTENYGDGRNFVSALMINLFEDKTKYIPTAEIEYDITEKTNQNVTAKLVNPSTEITIINNDGKDTYIFTENGEFAFEFQDKYGNIGIAEAKVDWIEKLPVQEDKITSEKYIIEENLISKIAPNTTVNDFKNNVETLQDIIFKDKDGNVLSEEDIITTNTKIQVGESLFYTLVVIGDINEDGEITTTDLAKLKLYCIEEELLEGVNLKAADLNRDGQITPTDLAQMKLYLIDLLEIE